MELLHPDDRAFMIGMLPDLFSEPHGPAQWNARVRRKDGSLVWVESTASNMLPDPEVNAIAITHRDISARKAAEVKLKKGSGNTGSLQPAPGGIRIYGCERLAGAPENHLLFYPDACSEHGNG